MILPILMSNGAAGWAAVGWGRKLHFNAIYRANRPSGAKPEGGRLDPSCSSRCAARTMGIDHPAAPFAPRTRRERGVSACRFTPCARATRHCLL